MKTQIAMVAALLCAALTISGPAEAKKKSGGGNVGIDLQFTGCAKAGVEAKCVIVRDFATGRSYDVTGSAIAPGTIVAVRGRATGGVTTCQQGPRVRVISSQVIGVCLPWRFF